LLPDAPVPDGRTVLTTPDAIGDEAVRGHGGHPPPFIRDTNEKLRVEGGPPRLGHAWSGRERPLDRFDLVVFAGFPVARDALADELVERLGEDRVRAAGDCRAPRRIHDAVLEGSLAGHAVGVELGAAALAAAP
jgi:hypothetical protein